jgi:hypothetical protein
MNVSRKSPKGSTLIFVFGTTFILILIGLFAIAAIALCGGNCELQNATDAGALSVARKCLTDINVKADSFSPTFYGDVSDKDHHINLENINWSLSKVMLVEINQDAMAFEKEGTDASAQNSSDVFISAQKLSTALDKELGDFNQLEPFYYSVANANSLRMLGNAQQKLEDPIERAYMDKGEKSSVFFDPDMFPKGFNAATLQPIKLMGKVWLPGYVPLDIGARGFNFVPQPIRPPHLVSQRAFASNLNKPQLQGKDTTHDYLPPIPNAYKLKSSVHSKLAAIACSQADCLGDGRAMELPHDFVRIAQSKPNYVIKVHENVATKLGGTWGKEQSGPPPTNIEKTFKRMEPWLDALPSPWEVFTSKDYSNQLGEMRAKFLQRTKEMLPFNDPNQSDPPFRQSKLVEGDASYCFRANNKIRYRYRDDSQGIISLAPWLPPQESQDPDGTSGPPDIVKLTRINYNFNPPANTSVTAGVLIQSNYTFQWIPSTGANGVLGQLAMARKVMVRFLDPGDTPNPALFKDDPPLQH